MFNCAVLKSGSVTAVLIRQVVASADEHMELVEQGDGILRIDAELPVLTSAAALERPPACQAMAAAEVNSQVGTVP